MKYTAIYARRSVADRDNKSLSIASQISDCEAKLTKDEECRHYIDNGKSGKDIEHRPAFLQMMEDAREGLIGRIIFKKLDRFSRSQRDFSNVMHELQKYGVTVTSVQENLDTSGLGKVLTNILVTFAEFERDTIVARCKDAYSTRAHETGFYKGGKGCYGYRPERRIVNGKMGSVLLPSDKAHVVQKAYELYANVNTSLDNVISYFVDNKIDVRVPRKPRANADKKIVAKNDGMSNMERSYVSKILKNPMYVRANAEVYQFLMSEGCEIIDDIDAFDGVHGLFKHKNSDGGYFIKVGYHEGLVDADTWLAVQDKKANNKCFPNNSTKSGPINSWLVGLTKCRNCGYSFVIYYKRNSPIKQLRYYGDTGAFKANGCVKKRLTTKPDDVERAVFHAMRERLNDLVIAKAKKVKPDAELESIKKEIIRIDGDINGLLDKLLDSDDAGDTDAFTKHVKQRVNALSSKKSELESKLHTRVRKSNVVDVEPLIDPMNRWDELTIVEKNTLAKTMIDVVYVSDEEGIDVKFSV